MVGLVGVSIHINFVFSSLYPQVIFVFSVEYFTALLIKFWNKHQDKLSEYFRTGETGCVEASNDLADEIGGFAEVVPIGRFSGSKKVGGWLYTDTPQTDLESFTQKEITAMKQQRLDPNSEQDKIGRASCRERVSSPV